MGGYGSGRSRNATDAVELLVAAVLKQDATETQRIVLSLDTAKRRGESGMSGASVLRLLNQVTGCLALSVRDAKANPPEHLGDVKVSLTNGGTIWIEVKGQTKKNWFADITQADYVRDGTDFLRAYAKSDASFNSRIKPVLRNQLDLDKPLTFTKKWPLADLWFADLALLETEAKKSRAGVTTPNDLAKFMDAKYLLHISGEGARYLRISELRPVLAYRAGGKLATELATNPASTALVRVAVGGTPGRNSTDFTYHVGYKNSNAPGRHKLHNYAISQSRMLTVVT